jgi:RND family efflux transporter MFP subunit
MKPRLLLLLPFALLNACNNESPPGGGSGGPPPQPVTVAPVIQKELVEWGEFSGRVEAKESVELKPRVSGYLDAVKFQSGALVNEKDTLFQIDPRSYQAAADQAAGELKRAEAAAKAAKNEQDRAASLLSVKAISPEQADTREAGHLEAQAALAVAQAGVRAAALNVEFAEVKAPISGRVSRAMVTAGNYVTAGQTLLTTLVSIDPVYVYVDMDENTLLRVQGLAREKKLALDDKGRVPAEIQLSGETAWNHKGWIESFDNRVDAGTGSMVVRVELPNADGKLTPGLFARVRLPLTAKYPALLVDDSAIRTDQSRKYVTMVDDKNLAQYRPVEPGPLYEGQRIIRKGLEPGEKIVVNGQARIFMPGMPVIPEMAPAKKPEPAPKTASN